ncbi:hypothetical protein ACHHYP_06143 [Achlya hypogyna]|uniref:Uncharacterized protein n=1 Tax=Achlya hypogyna TaxID=1202772 RepID=A0A1V9YVJ0_ACHHY|nr:hypothetical protein ACHHYP_06143 [Achlya hypogyna]
MGLWIGYVYLIWTLGASAWFLVLLGPSATNDHWWPHFTVHKTQTFLGDLFNTQLRLNQSGSYSLCDARFSTSKSYVSDVSPAMPRQVLQAPLAFDTVVTAMRKNSLNWNIRMFAHYCWVDVDRIYELSTTQRRATRCHVKYSANAGVYLEILLRNVDSASLLTDDFAVPLQVAIFEPMAATPRGLAWVNAMFHHTWLPVADEVAYWHASGLSYWQTQVTNYYQQGIQESIVIINALGHAQSVTIGQVAFTQRPLSEWTLAYAYNGFWNDLWQCQFNNYGLVRHSSNATDAAMATWESTVYGIVGNATVVDLVHSHLGIFGSIDVELVTAPEAVTALFTAFQTRMGQERIVPRQTLSLSTPCQGPGNDQT